MYVCGKGIGIGIRDQVVDTLFQAIKKATPAPNKFQQPDDAFFGRGLTKSLLLSLVRCMGPKITSQVDPEVGTYSSCVCVCVCVCVCLSVSVCIHTYRSIVLLLFLQKQNLI